MPTRKCKRHSWPMGHYFKELGSSRGNNFRPGRKREVRGLVKVISYYFDAATCARRSSGPLVVAPLYKDTRVSKLLDYNELPPQYVTYRIYRYLGENAREEEGRRDR